MPYYHPDIPYKTKEGHAVFQVAYGPLFSKWLAQSDLVDVGYGSSNADNYAMFFMANYVNRKKNFYPSLPQLHVNPFRKPRREDYIGKPPAVLPQESMKGCKRKYKLPITAQGTITPTGPTLM